MLQLKVSFICNEKSPQNLEEEILLFLNQKLNSLVQINLSKMQVKEEPFERVQVDSLRTKILHI